MKNIVQAFKSFFASFSFIFSNGLALWYLVPLALYVLLVLVLSLSLAAWLSPFITQWFNQVLGIHVQEENGGFWSKIIGLLSAGLGFAVSLAMKILIAYMLGRIMKYVILIVTSPLLAYLSEKTEEIKTGKTYTFNLAQLLKDALRGILISLRNLFLELIFMALGFIISFFIPILTPFVTAGLFAVNCYFMGFSMFDYIAERRRMGIAKSVGYMRRNQGRVFGLGLAFNLVSFIPLADWVISPINGAVGAVLADADIKMESPKHITKV